MALIRPADPSEIELVRSLFLEYQASLGISLCFQNFDEELRSLPGKYSPPAGRLLFAENDGEVIGCIALRPVTNSQAEMKRLYVRPAGRGMQLGRALVDRVIQEACDIGYERIVLDTLPSMGAAIRLYRSMGFEEIGPYYPNPVEGALFLELRIQAARPAEQSSVTIK